MVSRVFTAQKGTAIVAVALSAASAFAADPASSRKARPIGIQAAEISNPVETLDSPSESMSKDSKSILTNSPVARKTKSKTRIGATAASSSSKGVAAPAEPDRSSVRQVNYQSDLSPFPDPGANQTARPFRKIADIIPYDNYEPDTELAKKDPCANLCPRPLGGDCPDCRKDAEGTPESCPECPREEDIRRIGRVAGEPDREFRPRDFPHIQYCWEPTNLYHNPIYFEDVELERYGHTRHYVVQPVFSAAKFAVQLIGLPYQMSLYPVCDKQYSLGYYRPGEFVPYKYNQIPWNAKAAAVEVGCAAGGYFLFCPGVGP